MDDGKRVAGEGRCREDVERMEFELHRVGPRLYTGAQYRLRIGFVDRRAGSGGVDQRTR